MTSREPPPSSSTDFRPYLNTQVGQPYSAVNINQDRDLVQTYYFSKGYDNAQVSLFQQPEPDHPDAVDFTMKMVAGKQFFVRKVIVSGVERTKPSVVQQRITLHPGDPLNQTALLQMQRRLYDLALFNEVNTAIQNPNGDESYKNILLNLTEAKRWDISYGFGFEVQTGTPAEGCLSPAEQATVGDHQQLQLQSQRPYRGQSADSVQCKPHQSARHRPVDYPAHQLRNAGADRPAQLPGSALPQ